MSESRAQKPNVVFATVRVAALGAIAGAAGAAWANIATHSALAWTFEPPIRENVLKAIETGLRKDVPVTAGLGAVAGGLFGYHEAMRRRRQQTGSEI